MISAGNPGTADGLNAVLGLVRRKTTNQTINNSTTMTNDADLAWPVAANATYLLDAGLAYESSTVADLKVQWTVPSGATMSWHVIGIDTSLNLKLFATIAANTASTYGGAGAGSKIWLYVRGIVSISSTAGSLNLQWAQNTAEASNTIMHAGTHGVLRLI